MCSCAGKAENSVCAGCPVSAFTHGLSDHSVISLVWPLQARISWNERPLHRATISHPRYATMLDKLCEASKYKLEAPVDTALPWMKTTMREVALVSLRMRDEEGHAPGPRARAAIDRAVIQGATSKLRVLLHAFPRLERNLSGPTSWALGGLETQWSGKRVRIKRDDSFRPWIKAAKADGSLRRPGAVGVFQKGSIMEGAQGQASSRRIRVAAAVSMPGEATPVVSPESTEGFMAVQTHWAGITAAPDRAEEAVAEAWLGENAKEWCLPDARPVDRSAVENTLRRAPRTAPGPDGISYDVWRASGKHGISLLVSLATRAATGAPLPIPRRILGAAS